MDRDSLAARLRTAALVCVDAVAYALITTAAAIAVALVVAAATGGGLVRAKTVLFLIGFLLMAYATVRLWPSSPEELREDARDRQRAIASESAPERTRFQTLVAASPPLRWLPAPPPIRRIDPAGKLFLGSLFILLASYLMETALGIA
ncbi:DUF7555 family protein [Halalkalicoccus tibetensis]|uniref:Uncharacterized protein n=1 Tax=Halalkalicoccus tibetensis TaxID=175632 RepID=A0ABD5V4V2_9EURY